jgi:hypothetical protein
VESSGRERLMMDGKAGKAVRSKIHSPEAHGVNSAVWVWERAGHKGQGSSPGPEHPVNISRILARDVRNCRTKTTPCVEKKDLFEPDCRAVTLFGCRVKRLRLKSVVGFIGGAKPWGRERVSGLRLSVITR